MFQKGEKWNGNRKGRPKSPAIQLLMAAIKAEEIARKKEFWRHVAEKAFEDNSVLKEVIKKFIPDLKAYDGQIELRHKAEIRIIDFSKIGQKSDTK